MQELIRNDNDCNIKTLVKDDKVIVGNIVNGKWFKCQKEAYDFVSKCYFENNSNVEILNKCEDNYTKTYISKVIQLLEDIECKNEKSHTRTVKDVTILLTNDCNLRCKHCIDSCGETGKVNLPFDDIKKVVKWCNEKKVESISLSGGELLIRDDIEKILRYIRENFDGEIIALTNGVLISEKTVPLLISNVDKIDISLDGYDEKSVSKIRGEGVYKKVISSIDLLHKNGFERISLSMVLTSDNREHVEEFKALCKEKGVDKLLRVLSPEGRAFKNYSELERTSLNEHEETYTSDIIKEFSYKCYCENVHSDMCIDEKGDIYPCVLLKNERCKIGQIDDLISGNLLLFDNKILVDNVKGCSSCNIRYFCASNCIGYDMQVFLNEKNRELHCKRSKAVYANVWK